MMSPLFSFFEGEEKLIDQLSNGCDQAFQVLYARYQSKIYKLAMRYLKCEIQAQEVVQDVFMKLWIKRTCIQKERPIEAWLYTVGKNDILNKIKKQSISRKVMNQIKKTQVFEDNSFHDKFIYDDYNRVLSTTLNSLSEKQLIVFTMARKKYDLFTNCRTTKNIAFNCKNAHVKSTHSHQNSFIFSIDSIAFLIFYLYLMFSEVV